MRAADPLVRWTSRHSSTYAHQSAGSKDLAVFPSTIRHKATPKSLQWTNAVSCWGQTLPVHVPHTQCICGPKKIVVTKAWADASGGEESEARAHLSYARLGRASRQGPPFTIRPHCTFRTTRNARRQRSRLRDMNGQQSGPARLTHALVGSDSDRCRRGSSPAQMQPPASSRTSPPSRTRWPAPDSGPQRCPTWTDRRPLIRLSRPPLDAICQVGRVRLRPPIDRTFVWG